MGARHSSSGDAMGFVFMLVFFGFFIVVAIWGYKKEQQRRKEIEDYCHRNRLEYSETANNIPSIAYDFSLLRDRGHTNRWEYEMAGVRGDYNFSIFEHYSVSGHGKHRHVSIDSICVLSKENLRIPQFFVREENRFFDSLGKLFGGQDINFDGDPEFSKKFVLQGMIERDIRDFFDRNIRRAFVLKHVAGYKYEGNCDCFMVSVPGRLALKDRLTMLSVAMGLFKEMVPREDRYQENVF